MVLDVFQREAELSTLLTVRPLVRLREYYLMLA